MAGATDVLAVSCYVCSISLDMLVLVVVLVHLVNTTSYLGLDASSGTAVSPMITTARTHYGKYNITSARRDDLRTIVRM